MPHDDMDFDDGRWLGSTLVLLLLIAASALVIGWLL